MKIIVTGANGQLGNEMRVISKRFSQHSYIFTDVAELDICNKEAVMAFFEENKPDFVVNCAAYTAVTKAESDLEISRKINAEAVGILGEATKCVGAKMIHVSTDYVFDGLGHIPYTEEMNVCPQSVYGKTKLDGEIALQQSGAEYAILRTSWLYSSFGNNFVKTMIRLGQEKEKLTVIFDQIGTPTYAADLVEAIMTIVNAENFVGGVFHFSNEGVCSWYDFTKSIHKIYGITSCKVLPLETKDYPDSTPRPFYSVLNKAKIKSIYGLEIPHWEESLTRCIDVLKQEK